MAPRPIPATEAPENPVAVDREPAIGLPLIEAESATALWPAAVRRVLTEGHRVEGERPSLEVLNQLLCLRDPRRQTLSQAGSSFNPAVAVARFVWHLAASDDLAAIAFYEPRAQLFSDDGTTLSGSNTGQRLFGSDSGSDQLEGIISRLRADRHTRRAAAVVWRPEDALRESRDIPCTLSIACHLRGGQLLTTVSMRSNNALRLLPYNLFEFTMLAELIAAEVGAEPGPYWHSVNSLHVFLADLETAEATVASPADGSPSPPMPPMPRRGPLEQAELLVAYEAGLRRLFVQRETSHLPRLVRKAEDELEPYWFGLLAVLIVFSAARGGMEDAVDLDGLFQQVPVAIRDPLARAVDWSG